MFAGDQARQVFRFLRRVAPAPQLIDAQVRVSPIREANRGRRAADFFHRDCVFEIAKPGAAIVFAHRNAMQTQFAHFRPELARKLIAGVDVRRNRRDLVLRKPVNGFADHLGFIGKTKLKSRVGHGHCGLSFLDVNGISHRDRRLLL